MKILQQSPEPKKRGPKPFKPTRSHRSQVMLYIAGGMAEPEIAAVIGICQNTLRKHFEAELTVGRAKKIAANLDRLEKAADAGNVTAMRHLDGKFGAVKPSGQSKIGKKEIAANAAQSAAAGRLATPPPPKLVVSNA